MPKTLLLADRSLTTRRVVELTFKGEDIEVLAVSSGAKAMEAIAANPPDVVLADAGLKSQGAYELASFIKRTPALAHIPVVLLTAAFQPLDERLSRDGACDGVLVRPIDRVELAWKVKELLRSEGRDQAALAAAPVEAQLDTPDVSLEDRFDALDAALENGTVLSVGPPGDGSPHPVDGEWTAVDERFERADEELRRRSLGTRHLDPRLSSSASLAAGLTPDERASAIESLKRTFLELLNELDDAGHRSSGNVAPRE